MEYEFLVLTINDIRWMPLRKKQSFKFEAKVFLFILNQIANTKLVQILTRLLTVNIILGEQF